MSTLSNSIYTSVPLKKSTFTLLLIIIQSCGIRFFDSQGIILGVIILGLSFKGLLSIKRNDVFILMLIAFFLFINTILSDITEVKNVFFQYVLVLEAYSFMLLYQVPEQLLEDFYVVLKFIFIHALAGYIFFLIGSSLFKPVKLSTSYLTFYNIFYIAVSDDVIPRNTGLCWEPGLLQLMLNLFLFLSIKYQKSLFLLLLISAAILSTFSTTGYIILGLNYLYFLLINFRKNRKRFLIVMVLSIFMTAPILIMRGNISNKFNGENTSGLIRYRDFMISLELIKERPLMGHGNFDGTYLLSKPYVSRIESQVFTREYLHKAKSMEGGFTNGLLGIFCWYGLPLGLLTYYFFFKNRILIDKSIGRLIFFLIFILSFVSEPITFTSFFLLFPFSSYIYKYRGSVVYQIHNPTLAGN